MMEGNNLKTAVKKLRKRKESIASALDKAYLKNDMSSYISLEERYKRLDHTIDRLLYRLRSSGININKMELL